MSPERTVRPGESIQRALDEAGPGATVRLAEGTYAGSVLIRHPDVTLTGAGAGRTVLVPGDGVPPEMPRLHDDAGGAAVSGVNVYGEGAGGVRIGDLTVRGFSGAGVYAHTAAGVAVRGVEAADNGVWGIYLRECGGCEVVRCRASGSQYGGVALSFCQRADGLVAGNETFGNAFGVFVDNSSRVRVVRNECHGNAAGILLLNQTYDGEPDGGVRDCLVAGNDIHGNTLAAGAEPDGLGAAGPPISGVGIALIGTERVSVVDNAIHGNHPSGESVMGAAFVMGSSKDWGGADAAHNHILWNKVTGNSPLDFLLGVDLDLQTFSGNTADKGEPEGGWL